MVKSRLLLVLGFITVTAGGTLSGASAGASELDGQGLHCESTAFRHGLYTEGCAAVGAYPDYSSIFGETEASAYKLVDGQRFRLRRCWSASPGHTSTSTATKPTPVRAPAGPPPTSAAPPATSNLVSCPAGTPPRLP
jgi:hypothetical protein